MQRDPYYATIPSNVQRPCGFDTAQGVLYGPSELVCHAIWAARVPFIPALDADELTRLGAQRIDKIITRQFRFIYDLAANQEQAATFELRLIVRPSHNPGQTARVEVVFLGKVSDPNQQQARVAARALWRRFANSFPAEDPFGYPLEPISAADAFQRVYVPIPWEQLTRRDSVSEIRRFEDMVDVQRGAAALDNYFVHPFVPTLDMSALGRLFETLAAQTEPGFVAVSLQPQTLYPRERAHLSRMVGQFTQAAAFPPRPDPRDLADLSQDLRTQAQEVARLAGKEHDPLHRARIAAAAYRALLQEGDYLLSLRVHVVGMPEAALAICHAVGSELMNNGQNPIPSRWVRVVPQDDQQFAAALDNLKHLEHREWEPPVAPRPLRRFRYLVDARQAAGAFRLPIPSESGYMPGVLVKAEPFVAPQDDLEEEQRAATHEPTIVLGEIIHRGNPTGRAFRIPVSSLTRHSLIAGSTGSGKSTTIMALLAQLWSADLRIPFLVLYPIDKPDYRRLLRMPHLRDDLLIFTVGDQNTMPFQFNPFAVPVRTLVKTHISRLLRAFAAAFDLHPPLPMIYREALRRVYRENGWDILRDRGPQPGAAPGAPRFPTLSDFYAMIQQVTGELQYGREVQDNVRQASVIRIRDLLENAGHVLNVAESSDFATLLGRPVVMELGRLGSSEDITLIMGFLLATLAETLEKGSHAAPHLTIVEEAHRLMPKTATRQEPGMPAADAGEEFATLLAEVRGHNAGIMIAEQAPSQLVPGAIGNTLLKVMHWLEDKESFDLFADLMNLSPQQRAYARRLKPGEAIVRSPFGRPVHLRIAAAPDTGGGSPLADDDELAATMPGRAAAGGLRLPAPAKQAGRQGGGASRVAALLWNAPLGHCCAFCRPYVCGSGCRYLRAVRPLLGAAQQAGAPAAEMAALLTGDLAQRDATLPRIIQALEALPTIGQGHGAGAAYCLAAQTVYAAGRARQPQNLAALHNALLALFGNETVNT